MGKAKKTRKFAEVKRMLNPKDDRIKALRGEQQKKKVPASAPCRACARARWQPCALGWAYGFQGLQEGNRTHRRRIPIRRRKRCVTWMWHPGACSSRPWYKNTHTHIHTHTHTHTGADAHALNCLCAAVLYSSNPTL